VGIKRGDTVIPYSDFLGETRTAVQTFSIGYEFNVPSKRMDFTIRASAIDVKEFRTALNVIRQAMQSNYLDPSNADRLRDIVTQRLSADDSYTKKDESDWVLNPAYSFRNQKDTLFLALSSQFTRAHWDGRLKWLLHQPVGPEEIDRLISFAKGVLTSASVMSKAEIAQTLDRLDAKGVEAELVEYWKRNLSSYPDNELVGGLTRLTSEVEEDLRTGPAETIADLKELQQIVLNQSVRVDLTLNQSAINELRPELNEFLVSIHAHATEREGTPTDSMGSGDVIMAKLEKRYGLSHVPFPWYVGFVNPDGLTGNTIFYSDFLGYDQLDHKSLVQAVASKLLSGDGPQGLYKKARETGLAYGNSLTSDPSFRLIWYYADRSPDIPSLIELANSVVAKISDLHDPFLVEYSFRQSFPFPRTALTFSERGKALAWDIRDGNPPEKVRRFSEAIVHLRHDANLLSELTESAVASISGILLDKKYLQEQRTSRSIFFFVAPEKILSDIEHRLPIPKLLRLWPSDYWIE
jgi:hypothetical protein